MSDLQEQAMEAKLQKRKQALYERAENLRHMSSGGADGGFVRRNRRRVQLA